MSENVTQLLEWEATDGANRSLIIVTDNSLPKNDVNRKRIELAEYDTSEEEWVTQEEVAYVDELESFGIPESLID